MDQGIVSCTAIDATMDDTGIVRVVVESHLGDLILIIRDVIADIPVPVLC